MSFLNLHSWKMVKTRSELRSNSQAIIYFSVFWDQELMILSGHYTIVFRKICIFMGKFEAQTLTQMDESIIVGYSDFGAIGAEILPQGAISIIM